MHFTTRPSKKALIAVAITLALGNSNAIAQESKNDEANTENLEIIQVRGLKGSLVKSISNKRYANTVSDTITATDIGKLPDVTIADSLQRITGVQINRSGGEGSSVNVRGISQVGSTLNGEP